MPRLFTAIEMPEGLGQRLAMHRGSLRGARWVEREDYHLTLRFFGDVERGTAGAIADHLEELEAEPVEIALESLAAFGGARPRAVVALARPLPSLLSLQASHEALARSLGLDPEPRKYAPHVTLARLNGTRSAEVAEYLGLYGGLALEPFTATRIVLMSSRPGRGGGPYVVEAAYPLAPAS